MINVADEVNEELLYTKYYNSRVLIKISRV